MFTVTCLQHFSSMIAEQEKQEEMLEARYFQNDIVATAFEIFEKTNNFEVAIHFNTESDRSSSGT